MNIEVNPLQREVLKSGCLVLGASQPAFRILIEDINLDFVFIPGNSEASAEIQTPTGKSVIFTLMSFDNPLGTSYELTDIVTIAGRVLSIILYVHANSVAPIRRLISYTISAEQRQ